MFLDPEALNQSLLLQIVNRIWARIDGTLIVVCAASDAACRRMQMACRFEEEYGGDVQCTVDTDGALRARFGMDSTPSAILFDKHGRVDMTGALEHSTQPER